MTSPCLGRERSGGGRNPGEGALSVFSRSAGVELTGTHECGDVDLLIIMFISMFFLHICYSNHKLLLFEKLYKQCGLIVLLSASCFILI